MKPRPVKVVRRIFRKSSSASSTNSPVPRGQKSVLLSFAEHHSARVHTDTEESKRLESRNVRAPKYRLSTRRVLPINHKQCKEDGEEGLYVWVELLVGHITKNSETWRENDARDFARLYRHQSSQKKLQTPVAKRSQPIDQDSAATPTKPVIQKTAKYTSSVVTLNEVYKSPPKVSTTKRIPNPKTSLPKPVIEKTQEVAEVPAAMVLSTTPKTAVTEASPDVAIRRKNAFSACKFDITLDLEEMRKRSRDSVPAGLSETRLTRKSTRHSDVSSIRPNTSLSFISEPDSPDLTERDSMKFNLMCMGMALSIINQI